MRNVFALLTVALLLAAPVMASGILTVGGTGGAPGDWSQEWLENGVGSFDTILLFSESGDGLALPGLTDVGAGWIETDPVPGVFAELTGSATTSYYFYTNFANPGASDTFNLYALVGGMGGTLVDSATIDNFGVGSPLGFGLSLQGTPGTNGLADDLTKSGAVPEPTTMALAGGLFVGLATIRKRRNRRNNQ